MAVIVTNRNHTLEDLRTNSNDLSTLVGDGAALTTTGTNLVAAINEHDAELGSTSALTTTATTLVGAINEHDSELGDLTNLNTTASTIVGAINEHESDIGNMSLNTTATNLTAAINEVHGEFDTLSTGYGNRITDLETQNGTATLTTTANNISAAVNELDAELGDLSGLATAATTIVGAINEVHGSDDSRFDNVLKLDLTDTTVGGSNDSTQTVLSKVTFSNDVEVNSTFDIRNGSILIGSGGSLNIEGETFVNLGKGSNFTDGETYNAADGGLILNRGGVEDPAGTWTAREDVRILWDESEGHWFVKEFTDGANPTDVTSQLVTRYNAKDLIANNTESGISVTWDATNQNFDFNVNDPTIQLTGDVTGSATMTNLGNVSIATTIELNSLELGTDTTGQYASTITGGDGINATTPNTDDATAYTIDVDNTVVRTSGTQSINGEKTFVDAATFSDNVTVDGNLYVNGTTTTVNSATTTVDDPVFTLGGDTAPVSDDNKDRGIEFRWHNGSNAKVGFFGYDDSTGKFTFIPDATNSSEIFSGTKGTLDANIEWSDILSKPTLDNYVSWTARDHDGTSYTVTSGDILQFKEGSGIDVNFTADDELTITNTDRGSSQNIFKTISATNINPAPQEADWDQTGSIAADSNNDTVTFVEGSGIDIDTYPEGDAIRWVNTDRGSSQYIFKNVTAEQSDGTDRGTVVADNNNDTLYLRENGGIILGVNAGSDIITIGHADTSSVSNLSSDNSGRTFIQDIAFNFDTYGHVTSASVATGSVPTITWEIEDGDGTVLNMAESKRIKYVEGSGIDINWTDTSTGSAADPYDLTVTNTDRGSSQFIFKNLATTNTDSGYTWLDTGTATAEVNNDTFTFVDGGGVDLHIDTTGTNQALRIQHSDTSSQASVNNSNGTVIQDITLDTYGHITGINSLDGDTRWVNVTGDTMTGDLTVQANINCTGDITSTSDSRVKDNVRAIDNALDIVKQIDGVRFERNDIARNPTQIGVIAQDVEEVLPEVVAENGGLKSVNYGSMVALLIEAIKEQQKEIDELKARLV